jgi:hypothetical protein
MSWQSLYIKARLQLQPLDLIGHPEWEAQFPFHNTLPFVFEKQRVLLLASPKAGITSVTKWAFHNLGLMETALQYHPWVHRYRTEVYVQQQNVRIAFRRALEAGNWTVYKVVRNPYDRLVSSFHHAIKHSVLPQPPVPPSAITHFQAFLQHLQSHINQPIDPHLGLQKSVYEAVIPGLRPQVLWLDNLEAHLQDLCQLHNFPVAFSAAMAESKHNAQKVDTQFAQSVHLVSGFALFEAFPNDYRLFYQDPTIRTLAQEILAADLNAYNPKTAF